MRQVSEREQADIEAASGCRRHEEMEGAGSSRGMSPLPSACPQRHFVDGCRPCLPTKTSCWHETRAMGEHARIILPYKT